MFSRSRTVTLPEGVVAGQTIHVQAPDGRLNAIIVPPGFGPGSTFTVEFAPEAPPETAAAAPMAETASPYNPEYNKEQQQQQPYVVPPQESRPDDGFASGFGNSNYVPTAAPVYPSAPKY